MSLGGYSPVSSLYHQRKTIKRRVFFSFNFDDIMRVNNVRNAWRAHNRHAPDISSFTDSSLWESRKLEAPESVKSLIRNGIRGASVVCVLIGSTTWERRWVRHEIARSVIDGKGLLAVHLNSIRHHQSKTSHLHGPNPLDFIAVGKDYHGQFHLYEKRSEWQSAQGQYAWVWRKYADYQNAVDLPWYLSEPNYGYVTPLSRGVSTYCYMNNRGYAQIGRWIDTAALAVGR